MDNCTTSSYTVVGVVCRDRKGLVYDLFRTLKDIHIRVAYAKARCSRKPSRPAAFAVRLDGALVLVWCSSAMAIRGQVCKAVGARGAPLGAPRASLFRTGRVLTHEEVPDCACCSIAAGSASLLLMSPSLRCIRCMQDVDADCGCVCQVCVRGDMAEADLFVEEADGHRAERCAPHVLTCCQEPAMASAQL